MVFFFFRRAKIWTRVISFLFVLFRNPPARFHSDQMTMIPQAHKNNICIFGTHKLQSALSWSTVISFTWKYLSYLSKFSQLDTSCKDQLSSNIRSSPQHLPSPHCHLTNFPTICYCSSSPNIWFWWITGILMSPFYGFHPIVAESS